MSSVVHPINSTAVDQVNTRDQSDIVLSVIDLENPSTPPEDKALAPVASERRDTKGSYKGRKCCFDINTFCKNGNKTEKQLHSEETKTSTEDAIKASTCTIRHLCQLGTLLAIVLLSIYSTPSSVYGVLFVASIFELLYSYRSPNVKVFPKLINVATLIVFLAMFLVLEFSKTFEKNIYPTYGQGICFAAISLTMYVSVLVQHPFTIDYAKDSVGEEKWGDADFYTLNRNASLIWASGMLVIAILDSWRIILYAINGIDANAMPEILLVGTIVQQVLSLTCFGLTSAMASAYAKRARAKMEEGDISVVPKSVSLDRQHESSSTAIPIDVVVVLDSSSNVTAAV